MHTTIQPFSAFRMCHLQFYLAAALKLPFAVVEALSFPCIFSFPSAHVCCIMTSSVISVSCVHFKWLLSAES
jgi:hypothetical protein